MTSFGDSETTYGVIHIPEVFNNYMQYLLQRNWYAPQIWSILILVIFTALIKQGFGVHFSNSFTGELTELLVFIYVDNFDLIQSGENVDTTRQDMQYALSKLEELVEVTVGYLLFNKSAWYLVEYK